MNKDDIKLGHEYLVKHSSGLVKVRVLNIRALKYVVGPHSRSVTRYTCINLKTGRTIEIKSAVRFKYLSEVGE